MTSCASSPPPATRPASSRLRRARKRFNPKRLGALGRSGCDCIRRPHPPFNCGTRNLGAHDPEKWFPVFGQDHAQTRQAVEGLNDMLQNAGTTTAAPDGLIKDTATQTFVKDVIEESKRQPVLVDFWAEWCGPCKQLTPVLEKVVRAAKGKVKLVKMDIDKHPAIPGQLGIQSIPAVFAFVNGQPVDGFMGALPESQVLAFIERLTKDKLGGAAQDLLKEAEAALAQNDPAAAAQIYAELLAEEPGNVTALAGLARCYFETGAVD